MPEFSYPDLLKWFSEKLSDDKAADERMQAVIIFPFILGIVLSAAYWYMRFHDVNKLLIILTSKDGLPIVSSITSIIIFSLKDDNLKELQISFFEKIGSYTLPAHSKTFFESEKIEGLSVDIMKDVLTDKSNKPEIKSK